MRDALISVCVCYILLIILLLFCFNLFFRYFPFFLLFFLCKKSAPSFPLLRYVFFFRPSSTTFFLTTYS
eukprot:UN02765